MPGAFSPLLACLCGGRKPSLTNEPLKADGKQTPQPLFSCPPEADDADTWKHRREATEALALVQLQRELGALQGTWLSRARAALSNVATFVGATDVRFYGAAGAAADGPANSFVLLATAPDHDRVAAAPGGEQCSVPMLGEEVWPASAGPRAKEANACMPDTLPTGCSRVPPARSSHVDLLPSMLDRMLVDEAPILESAPPRSPGPTLRANSQCLNAGSAAEGGATTASCHPGDAVVLLPLTVGSSIAGALFISRYGRHVANAKPPPPASPQALKDGAAPGPGRTAAILASSISERSTLPAAARPEPCPSLLTSQQALQQLSLSLSMCLLGADVPYLSALCDSLHQLGAASSMQQLVGGLCDAVAHHLRQRFLLEPRVVAGLVPEPASAVGLLLSWGADRAAPPLSSRTPSKLTRATTSIIPNHNEPISGEPDGARVAGPVAALLGKEAASVAGRAHSDTAPRVSRHNTGGALVDRDGQRPARQATAQRVVALSQNDVAAMDTKAATATSNFVTLRVKPFPLAQTLLRHLIRKAGTFAVDAASTPGARAHAVVVEDCIAHVQDPRKPSRDILMLLANTGTGASPAASLGDRFGSSGNGALCAGSSSFTSGRRGVCSLLLLVLPAGDGKGVLGLYVTFPQQLPQQLLREARSGLLEILEATSETIARKLANELSVELETLATAAPGSYAVVEGREGPEGDGCPKDDGCTGTAPENVLDGCVLPIRPTDSRTVNADTEGERLVPLFGPLVQSFLYDSRGGGHGSVAGPNVGSGGGVQVRSMNLMDTAASPHGAGDNMVAMTSLLSGNYSALAVSNHPTISLACELGSRSTNVIHMEEFDQVHNTMRAQMPLLVASMQSSISNARAEAAVAAVTSSRQGPISTGNSFQNFSHAAPDQGDLAQLELHSQLGHGGCAVVFKGTMGTLDCAIKLMEMPEVDDVEDGDSADGEAEERSPVEAAPTDKQPEQAAPTDKEPKQATEEGNGAKQLAARRALLRNAMELAAMTSISHPNIMQVYSTFSNITLGRRSMPDGSERFFLRPVEQAEAYLEADAPPVCVAIVCEWCDKGCLGSALHKRTFPAMVHLSGKTPGAVSSSAPIAGAGKGTRMIDFKGVLMTLLDVAMALRHLHGHNLIHRDLKPANVLLRTNTMDPRGFTAKLADFGFVTLLNQAGDEKSGGEPFVFVEESCGTVTHMAPESWIKPARLDASCDVFSFGILMWELVAGGTRPYPEIQPNDVARAVRRGLRPSFNEGIPVQYRFLAQRCWAAEPGHRPRSSELVTAISQLLSRM